MCRRSLAMRPPTADLGARTASTSTSVANLGSFLSTGLAGDAATAADDADADANQPDEPPTTVASRDVGAGGTGRGSCRTWSPGRTRGRADARPGSP